tara:strand:- start:43 stop:357 length:315 start_codon:yes stop_codon:yes gene_type:complete
MMDIDLDGYCHNLVTLIMIDNYPHLKSIIGLTLMFDRRKDRELILAKKPLIVLEDELWQINQLSKLRKDLRNRKKRLEKVIAVKRLALQAVQEKIAREVENEKK